MSNKFISFRFFNLDKVKKIIYSIGYFIYKILKLESFLIIVLLFVLFEIILFEFNYKLSINVSNSLPFRVFIVDRNKSSIDKAKAGDYIQFRNNNTHYYNGKNITKRILATGGNELDIHQLNKPENNIQAKIQFDNIVLKVKNYTKFGTKIHTNNIKIIPKNYYFIYGINEDSFDSRYREFGLINREDIIGVARPLF